jgi:hypothetical protein
VKHFFETLQIQRWDDHRYYHHCRINQSLHLFIDPVWSALIAWLVSMTSRQAGHFFFEPLGYDDINKATHEHKEAIKVGYNLRRKVVLLSIWALLPLAIHLEPGLFGLMQPHEGAYGFVRAVGTAWLYLGVGALLFRTLHLFFLQGAEAGLAWMSKIITDPFHDIYLYHKAPWQLLQGKRFATAEELAAEAPAGMAQQH